MSPSPLHEGWGCLSPTSAKDMRVFVKRMKVSGSGDIRQLRFHTTAVLKVWLAYRGESLRLFGILWVARLLSPLPKEKNDKKSGHLEGEK